MACNEIADISSEHFTLARCGLIDEDLRAAFDEAARALILRGADAVDRTKPYHVMVWGQGVAGLAPLLPPPASADSTEDSSNDDDACCPLLPLVRERCTLLGVARRVLRRCTEESGVRGLRAQMMSVRLLVSPDGCGEGAQDWHLDYQQSGIENKTVFVSVTASTPENCTEYLEFDPREDPALLDSFRGGAAATAAAEGEAAAPAPSLSALRHPHAVRPLLMGVHEACVLNTSRVFHRRGVCADSGGGAGGEESRRSRWPPAARVTFNVDFALVGGRGGVSQEVADAFVCIDTETSLASGGVVGVECIDDLDFYDVVLK